MDLVTYACLLLILSVQVAQMFRWQIKENQSAYDRYLIQPRVLRDITNLDTTTIIFGIKVKFPFGFSPTAMQALAHPEGEVATSKAAASCGILMGLSNYSTIPLEKVIANGKYNPYVMQMSLLKNKAAMIQMVKRAEGKLPSISLQ
jgi:L-lactate dehydrogenase (FMN-dependent) and related alpha-hydroxy acid dehydrogenases